jgi:hypothetical protein
MPSPKLHLDEHVSHRLAGQLRQYGFDVTSVLEAGMVEAEDEQLLAYAASQQRAVVTFNHKDFALLHGEYAAEGGALGDYPFDGGAARCDTPPFVAAVEHVHGR